MQELSLLRRCREEFRLLGFCASAHPLMLASSLPRQTLPAALMPRRAGQTVQMAGWAIAAKLVRTRKDGRFMKFLSCEDLSGTFEATLFPDAYERLAPRTFGPGPYLFTGRIELAQGAFSICVDDLEMLETGLFAEDPDTSED